MRGAKSTVVSIWWRAHSERPAAVISSTLVNSASSRQWASWKVTASVKASTNETTQNTTATCHAGCSSSGITRDQVTKAALPSQKPISWRPRGQRSGTSPIFPSRR